MLSDEGSDALGFEPELWDAANKLRGKMDAAEYRRVVLPLVFLKYVSDAFVDTRERLIKEGKDPDERDEYVEKRIIWVPEKARWTDIVKTAEAWDGAPKDDSIGKIIDNAMVAIENENPGLKHVLVARFNKPEIDRRVLRDVVILFGDLPSFGDEEARSKDVIGRVYEYFIGEFAQLENKGGEYFTPRSVVRLLVELLQPYEGKIYDGCCGSGGMFVQSLNFMNAHSGKKANISVFGQESNPETWRLAKMNLAIRHIPANLGDTWADTLHNDLHPDLEAEYVMVNPPFNIKDWGWEEAQKKNYDYIYGFPPKGNANYAWIQHYLSKLAGNGMAAIIMSNGSLSSRLMEEKRIRQKIIADDKLDCVLMLPDRLFHNTGIFACVWILSNNKKDPKFRDRSGETLFIDCRAMGEMVSRKLREFTKEDVEKIAGAYDSWRSKDDYKSYRDQRGFCKAVTTEVEIAEHEEIIVPGRYVGVPPVPDDGEPFEKKMKRLTKEIGEQFAESERLEEEIRMYLGELGFDF